MDEDSSHLRQLNKDLKQQIQELEKQEQSFKTLTKPEKLKSAQIMNQTLAQGEQTLKQFNVALKFFQPGTKENQEFQDLADKHKRKLNQHRQVYEQMEQEIKDFASFSKNTAFSPTDEEAQNMDDFVREKALNNVQSVHDTDQMIFDVWRQAIDTANLMKDTNQELKRQLGHIEQLYYFDANINGFIERATGQVAALERKSWQKKIIMVTLAGILFLVMILLMVKKIVG